MVDGETNRNSIKRENFLKVEVDRISGSGNILAVPIHGNPDLIHVERGIIGETAVAYVEDGDIHDAVSGKITAKILHYDNIEDAINALTNDTPTEMRCGELLKIGDRTIVEAGQTKVITPELNVKYIAAPNVDSDREGDIVKVKTINGNVAQGGVEHEGDYEGVSKFKRRVNKKQNTADSPKRPWAKPSSDGKDDNSSDEKDTKNPLKDTGGELNDLI